MMRNAEEQAAWQKEQDRYAHPSVLGLWAGSTDVGLALTTRQRGHHHGGRGFGARHAA